MHKCKNQAIKKAMSTRFTSLTWRSTWGPHHTHSHTYITCLSCQLCDTGYISEFKSQEVTIKQKGKTTHIMYGAKNRRSSWRNISLLTDVLTSPIIITGELKPGYYICKRSGVFRNPWILSLGPCMIVCPIVWLSLLVIWTQICIQHHIVWQLRQVI